MDSTWREIQHLREAPMAQLRARYRELFKEEPRTIHRECLFRRLAWRLQALAEGGLSAAAHQRADVIANDADIRVIPPAGFLLGEQNGAPPGGRVYTRLDRRIPRPGTVLSREYRGSTITVRVLVNGFEYQGRRYGSLSAIATEVTGTRWNGLAFFGLTGVRHSGKRGRHV